MKIQKGNQYNILPIIIADLTSNEYLIVIDQFNRRWKLEPVTNENIVMPFKITPLPND